MSAIAILVSFSVMVTAAVMQLFAPSAVQRFFRLRTCPHGFLQFVAIVELVAAVFLIVPETRLWGIWAAAGMLMAALIVTAYNLQLIWVCAGLVLLLSLVPAATAQ